MKLYLKIFSSHKILFSLLLCGLSIFAFSSIMLLYKFMIELTDHTLLFALKHIFFYFMIVIVLCFNLHLILDKMIYVCKPQLEVLLLCGFPLGDIARGFSMMILLSGMAGGIISDILFFFLVSGNMAITVLLLGIVYVVFFLLYFVEYKIVYRILSGRFYNV